MSELGKIITELQVNGISSTPKKGNRGRKGGAGPSDHRALTIEGKTVMVPVYNHVSKNSNYLLSEEPDGEFILQNSEDSKIKELSTTQEPSFYSLKTKDGIRDQPRSRGLGDVYKRQIINWNHYSFPFNS